MNKRVSLKDIAGKVGVSTALVSYVLNGLEKEKRVSPAVVEKIRAAARELNYKPNQIARSLRSGSTNTLGLIVADIANPFFGQLARVIEDEASRFQYVVILGSSDEDCAKSASLIDTLLDRQVDGFILVPSEGCAEQVELLVSRNIPVVLTDRYLPGIPAHAVVLDNYGATREAVSHLVGNGYRRIALVAYASSLVHMQERIRGYCEAMDAAGMGANKLVETVSYDSAKADTEKLVAALVKEQKTEAVIFATNALTLFGLYAVKKHNFRVPEELAVIGFDGNEAFDFFTPPLTYLRQPVEAIGRESVRILLEQIRGELHQTVHLELKHQLVERGSSGRSPGVD